MDNNPQPPSQSISEPTPQTILQTPLATNNLTEGHHTPPVTVILLLLFFWPLAIYFMWREKRYHKWFAVLVSIYPIIAIITLSLMALLVLPKITAHYKETGIDPLTTWIPLLIALIVNLIQLSFGIYLFIKTKAPSSTPKFLLLIAIILLLIDPFILGLSIASILHSVILPIYPLTALD